MAQFINITPPACPAGARIVPGAGQTRPEGHKTDKMKTYRFQVTVPNPYEYCMDMQQPYITTIAGYKNEISGFVRDNDLFKLSVRFEGYPIKLIEANEYFNNYDLYQ